MKIRYRLRDVVDFMTSIRGKPLKHEGTVETIPRGHLEVIRQGEFTVEGME